MDNCDYTHRFMASWDRNFIYNGWIYPYSARNSNHRCFDQNYYWAKSRLTDELYSNGIIKGQEGFIFFFTFVFLALGISLYFDSWEKQGSITKIPTG